MLLVTCAGEDPGPSVPPPPPTETQDVVNVLHGVDVPDPYRWLEDQESPDTRRWIDRQNDYTDSVLQVLSGREAIRATAARVLERDVIGLPNERGGRYFFERRTRQSESRRLVHARGCRR